MCTITDKLNYLQLFTYLKKKKKLLNGGTGLPKFLSSHSKNLFRVSLGTGEEENQSPQQEGSRGCPEPTSADPWEDEPEMSRSHTLL